MDELILRAAQVVGTSAPRLKTRTIARRVAASKRSRQSTIAAATELAALHATSADQGAASSGRGAPALQHLEQLLGHGLEPRTQQAALSSC